MAIRLHNTATITRLMSNVKKFLVNYSNISNYLLFSIHYIKVICCTFNKFFAHFMCISYIDIIYYLVYNFIYNKL